MINDGQKRNAKRDALAWDYFTDFSKMKPVLDSAGVKPNDKVISIGDYSSGISLYFMRRRGWTTMWPNSSVSDEDFKRDIDQGATYAVVSNGGERRMNAQTMTRFLKNKVADVYGVKVYKL